MSIFAIVDNTDIEIIELQAIYFIQTLTYYFPAPEVACHDELLNVIVALIPSHEIKKINIALAQVDTYKSSEGEYAIIMLRAALHQKRIMQNSHIASLEQEVAQLSDPIKRSKSDIANDTSIPILETAMEIASLIRADVHYPFLAEIINLEARILQRARGLNVTMATIKEEEILYSALHFARTFRKNESPIDRLTYSAKTLYLEANSIRPTSIMGKTLGLFGGKLAETPQLIWDLSQFFRKIQKTCVEHPAENKSMRLNGR